MGELEKEFVPYEIALDMKSIGFNEPCFGYYSNGEFVHRSHTNNYMQRFRYAVPTFRQAFKWFREKYGYYYQIGNSGDNTKFLMLRNSEMSIVWNDKGFNTYEESELACLKKILEIVENIK